MLSEYDLFYMIWWKKKLWLVYRSLRTVLCTDLCEQFSFKLEMSTGITGLLSFKTVWNTLHSVKVKVTQESEHSSSHFCAKFSIIKANLVCWSSEVTCWCDEALSSTSVFDVCIWWLHQLKKRLLILFIFCHAINFWGLCLCDFVRNTFDISLCVDDHQMLFFLFCMMTNTTEVACLGGDRGLW